MHIWCSVTTGRLTVTTFTVTMATLKDFSCYLLVILAIFGVQADGRFNHYAKRQPDSSNNDCDWRMMSPDQSCPIRRYPLFVAFQRVRSPEQLLLLLQETNLRDLCAQGTQMLTCYQTHLQGIPEKCDSRFRERKEILLYLGQIIPMVQHACANDIDLVQRNVQCYANVQRVQDVQDCVQQVTGWGPNSRPSPDQQRKDTCQTIREVVTCASNKLGSASECSAEAKQYFDQVTNQLFTVFQPLCDKLRTESEGRGGPRLNFRNFF